MLSLVTDTIQAGKQAVQAEANRIQRRATISAVMIYLMGLGLAFAMVGGAVLLAPVIGLGWSLLCAAGALILAGAIGFAIVSARG